MAPWAGWEMEGTFTPLKMSLIQEKTYIELCTLPRLQQFKLNETHSWRNWEIQTNKDETLVSEPIKMEGIPTGINFLLSKYPRHIFPLLTAILNLMNLKSNRCMIYMIFILFNDEILLYKLIKMEHYEQEMYMVTVNFTFCSHVIIINAPCHHDVTMTHTELLPCVS